MSSKLVQFVSSLGMCVVRVQGYVLFGFRDVSCSSSGICVVRVQGCVLFEFRDIVGRIRQKYRILRVFNLVHDRKNFIQKFQKI